MRRRWCSTIEIVIISRWFIVACFPRNQSSTYLANDTSPPHHRPNLHHGPLAHLRRLHHRIRLHYHIVPQPHPALAPHRTPTATPPLNILLRLHVYPDFGPLVHNHPVAERNRRKRAADFAVGVQHRVGAYGDGVGAGELGVLGDQGRLVQADG